MAEEILSKPPTKRNQVEPKTAGWLVYFDFLGWMRKNMDIYQLVIKASHVVPYIYDKFLAFFYKKAMKYCGRGVYLRPMSSDFKGLENLSVGDGTSIPSVNLGIHDKILYG